MGKAARYVPKEDIYAWDDPSLLLFKTSREYPLLKLKFNPEEMKALVGTDLFFIDEEEDEHLVQMEYVNQFFEKVYDGKED
jgi:hypothetical protein